MTLEQIEEKIKFLNGRHPQKDFLLEHFTEFKNDLVELHSQLSFKELVEKLVSYCETSHNAATLYQNYRIEHCKAELIRRFEILLEKYHD